MRRGRRPPLLITLFAVGVYAAGVITLVGLVGWGWPLLDAAGVAVSVAILALWGSLWAGRATAGHSQRRQRSKKDGADR